MTSRVSFPKLVLETLRRHTAAVFITVLGFFIHIVTFFMQVQNILSAEYYMEEYSLYEALSGAVINKVSPEQAEYIAQELQELCSPNLTNGIIALIVGVYLAFDFLRYMHSKRETDFYESLPIRRQTQFSALFVSCFALFIVLSVLTTGIETAIVFGTSYGTTSMLQGMLWNLVCMIIAFLVSWFITALAMVMTGHSIIAFLGLGVFASYIPLILAYLIPVYADRFFDTYAGYTISEKVYYLSPVTLIYKMTNSWYDWTLKDHWTYIIGSVIFAVVIAIITYLLFIRRPSEAAGRAMAFEKANSTIRFMLVIPLTLYAGIFLEEIATMTSTAWLIFGILFAAFLLHGIMECIFQFDIRAMVSKKKQLLVTILFCLAFVFVFWIDLFKYDEYIPDADDVKMVKMESYLFGWTDITWDTERDWLQGELVDDAIAVAREIKDSQEPSEDEYYYMDYVTFTYVMKNGVEVTRAYSYDASNASDNLNKLYANEDFKDDFCVLYNIDRSKITSLSVNNGVSSNELELSEEEMDQFVDIFLEEYSAMELKQKFSDVAVYHLYVDYKCDSLGYNNTDYYYIYPSFTKTIEFLKTKGISDFYESEDFTITNMEIFDAEKYASSSHDTSNAYVSDPAQLRELKQYLIVSDFMYENYYHEGSNEYLYSEIVVKTSFGTDYISVYIKQADLDKVLGD